MEEIRPQPQKLNETSKEKSSFNLFLQKGQEQADFDRKGTR